MSPQNDDHKKTQQIDLLGSLFHDLQSKFTGLDQRQRETELKQAETVIYYKNIFDKLEDQKKSFDDFKKETNGHRDDLHKTLSEIKISLLPKPSTMNDIVRLVAVSVVGSILIAIVAFMLTHGSELAKFIH